jgi:hypothetical protein
VIRDCRYGFLKSFLPIDNIIHDYIGKTTPTDERKYILKTASIATIKMA